jgi:hypothetical protein
MKLFARIFGISLTLSVFGSAIWLVLNLQPALDWWRLRSYDPPQAIVQLATDSSMSTEGTRLFFIHEPELLTKQNFSGKCNITEETIVLGCYLSRQKIYILDVEDQRLEGVKQVTAAHEMLHAAYDRLSGAERTRIDELLMAHYESMVDERLISTINSYRARDPSIVPNELHSILGTEVRDLPSSLEDYYSRYFEDRFIVVSYAEAYEAEFRKLKDQIAMYDERLASLTAIINEKETQISQLGVALQQELLQLDRLRIDTEAYNSAVPIFNEKVNTYNSIIASLEISVNTYNDIVQARNAIATEEKVLIEAIDTRAMEL